MRFATKPNRRETILGVIYLILYVWVLPMAVPQLAVRFLPRLNAAQVNFLFFCLNFVVTGWIFRRYLIQSLKDALQVPGRTLWAALLGYLASTLLGSLVAAAILRVSPEFMNVNDQTVGAMVQQNQALMAVGAVFLAPVTEELLFRGLIFRGLFNRGPVLAYAVSMVLFSLIHISGYVGVYEAEHLFLCFLQYLAPAFCLCFAYHRSGTLAAPILMHMLSNLVAVSAMR